eukprot:RCo007679
MRQQNLCVEKTSFPPLSPMTPYSPTVLQLKNDKTDLLAKAFPSLTSACAEIVNLNSILNLPKGTEHFFSDVHGEYEAFIHVLRNCSGVIRNKAKETFKDMSEEELKEFCTLVYYPEEKLPLLLEKSHDRKALLGRLLSQVVMLCRVFSRKYTRSYVRKAMPPTFAHAIEELLQELPSDTTASANNYDRAQYISTIISTIVSVGEAEDFICAVAHLCQRLAVAKLHVIGDIWDRGPGAEIILDTLCKYHSVDIQWGNHDIVWMGAAAGSDVCIANNIRVALRYSNMKTLEEGYAISMLPLVSFAEETYKTDPCKNFIPKASSDEPFTTKERELIGKMHKAIAIIQTKLEAEVIHRHPEWKMDDRLVLEMIDFTNYTIKMPDGKVYELNDKNFPTVDPANPNKLTPAEKNVVDRLRMSHLRSERLQRHARLMFSNGTAYLISNGRLLFHGCVPLSPEGELVEAAFTGKSLSGRDLMDEVDMICRRGYFSTDPVEKQNGADMMWYSWAGPASPMFGKDKMATFERYFIDDKTPWKENNNPYYKLRENPDICAKILRNFGLDPEKGVIINGHTPVKVVKGETPVKAGGKCLVIDGGFSKAYQKETGIAGYTLISNSVGMALVAYKPFVSLSRAIYDNEDLYEETVYLGGGGHHLSEGERVNRTFIKDTDIGKELRLQIRDLKLLIQAYLSGQKRQTSPSGDSRALLPSEWLPPM